VLTPPESELKPSGRLALELGRLLFSRKSEVDICNALCRYCLDEVGAKLAWMGLVEGEAHKLSPVCISPVRVEYLDFAGVPWHEAPDAQDPVARALAAGEIWVANDIDAEEAPKTWKSAASSLEFRSTVALPISGDSGIAGVLSLYGPTVDYFTEGRLDLLHLLCELTALALEQCRNSRQVQRTTQELEEAVEARTANLEHQYVRLAALAEISLNTDDPGKVLDSIAETTARLLPATCGASIILWDAKAQKFYTSVSTIPGQHRDSTATRVRREGGATRWIVENREPLLVSDVRKTPFPPNPMHEEVGIKAFAGVPVLANGEVVGVLYALDQHHRKYSQEDLDFLTTMASRVGAALVSARLLESEREQRRLAEALREVTSDLNSTLELPVILNRLLDHLSKIMPFDCGFVLIERDGRYRAEAVRGTAACQQHAAVHPTECCGHVFQAALRDRCPHILDDIRSDERLKCCNLLEGQVSVLTLPLLSADRSVGMLALSSRLPGYFGAKEADVAFSFAQQAAIAVRNAGLFSEVKRMATLDPLTKVYNRGHFFEMATLAFKGSLRYKRPLSVFMLDIDNFKQINDAHGHQVGDDVLRTVVERFSRIVRDIDILGRYGGDEFVILLPETDLSEAAQVAERLRENISESPIPTSVGSIDISVSIGIATVSPDTPTLTTLLKRADDALYQSKIAGRNCVSSEVRHPMSPSN